MKLLVFSLLILSLTCAAQTQPPIAATEDVSGMYTFLKDGEFVQIDVDGTRVTGFISWLGESDSDKGAVLDLMFKDGELKGNALHFITKPVHGTWFEFSGTIERGDGKDPNKEGYRILKGKLTQFTEEQTKKTTAKSRELTMKSFPMNALAAGH